MPKGNNEQLTATAIYSDGTTSDVTEDAVWNNSNTTHMTITKGKVDGHGIGSGIVSATHDGITSNELEFSITAAELRRIQLTPPFNSVPNGISVQLKATGIYTDLTTADISDSVVWESASTSIATVDTLGLATGVGVGSTSIQASKDGITSRSASIKVTSAVLSSIQVTPPTNNIAKGTSTQLVATGIYSDGSTQILTDTASWTSSLTSIATIESNGDSEPGLSLGVDTGTTTVTATVGAISGSASLTVTSATLVSIQVTPPSPSVAKGVTQQFVATGIYTDATTQILTSSVSWVSSDSGIATIESGGINTGLSSTLATGSVTVTATLGAVSGSASLTVTAAELVSVQITPPLPSIAKGVTQQFVATGIYTDSTTQILTSVASWVSSSVSVATVESSSDTNPGLATGTGEGTATITATVNDIKGTTTLTVTPAALVSVQVTPPTPSIAKGVTQQFVATGTYTDSTTQILTDSASWASSSTSIATIESEGDTTPGLANGAGVGSATITATVDGISGSAALTVTPATLVSIQVTPSSPSIAKGAHNSL